MASGKRTRGNNEGSIFPIDGALHVEVSVGRTASGKLKRVRRKVPIRKGASKATNADARAMIDEIKSEHLVDLGGLDESLNVEQYLTRWLNDHVKHQHAGGTYKNYRSAVNVHLIPRIGRIKLAKLNAAQIQGMLAEMADDGVNPPTRKNCYIVLSAAIQKAVRLRMVRENPCEFVDKPKSKREQIDPFTEDEMRLILRTVAKDRLRAWYYLAFSTGMRPGELSGLPWKNVDLKRGLIYVTQKYNTMTYKIEDELKTESSFRTIELVEATILALTEHRKLTSKEGFKSELVFTSPGGGILRPDNFRDREWKRLLLAMGLKYRGLHQTRHTFATIALLHGVAVRTVSTILGHANPSVTVDKYSHYMPTHQAIARQQVQHLFPTGC